jgi:hypothetical protein
MPYLVQAAVPGKLDAVSISVTSREEALKIAALWQEEGRSGIRIIADGRIYTPIELAANHQDN